MITYRPFCNWDLPAVVELWNVGMRSRAAAVPLSRTEFDVFVASKPYFDPRGIIIACENEQPIGFVHAGFGCNEQQSHIDRSFGVISMVVVHPGFRRRGIGRSLVRHAEQFLREAGASVLYAGGMNPVDPFYLGLYGGSELPGVLTSDSAAQALFASLGYKPVDTCLIYQRSLDAPVVVVDVRFPKLAREFHIEVRHNPPPESWWAACLRGVFDQTHFVAIDSQAREVASARVWVLSLMERSWATPSVGVYDVDVAEDHRGKGLGKWLLFQMLRQIRDDGARLVEIQTMERNSAARSLYESVGFRELDRGTIFRAPPFP